MDTIKSIKSLAESTDFHSITSTHVFHTDSNDILRQVEDGENIPVIDFSLLTSTNHDLRSEAIHLLGKACEDWGFFMLVNHGVEERLMKGIMEACLGFFDLTEKEKREFEGKHPLDPIVYGTSFNAACTLGKFPLWRDFLKLLVHPEFHCPNKPSGFREVVDEYTKETRRITQELLKATSESLGLEPTYAHKALNMESGFQQLAVNYYPPCPNPELAIGLPPHTDHGLFTILITNGIPGLQVYHNHKWINVNATPNALLINTGDHMEIMTNGKYKSLVHRAVVNNKSTRISIVVANGSSSDTIVSPAPELIDNKSNPIAYIGMKFQDYVELRYNNKLGGKSCLGHVKINSNN